MSSGLVHLLFDLVLGLLVMFLQWWVFLLRRRVQMLQERVLWQDQCITSLLGK